MSMTFFKIMIFVQLFFSFAIVVYTHNLPTDALNHFDSFSTLAGEVTVEQTAQQISSAVNRQTDIPILDVGALVFYSGNILLDFFVNFIFAIPTMLALMVNAVGQLVGIPDYFAVYFQMFATVLFGIMYIFTLLQFIQRVRSGSTVV